jgi:hypothetical protein
VTIADTTSGAILYCTTDGTTPTTSSSVCSNPATVSKTEFMQAIAVAPGKFASAVASAGYVINLNAAPTPAFSPAGGTYTGSQSVTISDSLSGANIYYTTDGSSPSASGCSSTPSASATLYTGPITVSQSEILSAIATASGYCNSGVATAAYTIQAPVAVPTIGNLSPTSATVGGSAFTLTVNGTNFDSGSTVKWGSTALTTTYVSSTQLTASVPANLIASAGSVVVSVVTSAGASAYSAFAVNPALPTITGLSPTSATAGGAGFTLTVNGMNIDSSAKVNWNGSALATTYVSATQVTATVPANLIASAGTASITVSTTAGTSGASTITIQSGTPTITGITPSSATVGGAAFTLTVNGTNFDSSAKASWNGTALTTSYVNANQVTAAVPANLIASAGTASIAVTTAAGTSSTSSFTVQAASPTISGTSPTSATVGGAAFTLTVNGTNFDSSTKVNWNGAALTTTYINGTKVTANVPASLIASVGTANISVTTNAGTSAVSTFTIQLGAPTITTISPTSVTVGGSAFTLTVNGSNFDSSAVVKWNGTALATTPLSSTQLAATVPANLIASTGSASITVATSVGTSSASSLAIQQAGVPTISTLDPASVTAGGSAFLLTVNGTGFDSSSVIKWNGAALTTIYVNSTELQTAISANLVASAGTVSVTVSGTGGASTASSFAIKLDTPTISGFNPTSASSGDSSFTTLTVNGTNFDSSAVVNWNSTALTTTFVNAAQVSAAVPASLIASPVTASITVTTTVGTSTASNFTVNLGKPTISSTDPTSVTVGGASFPLKVTGTNFDSSAKINWNGTALTTQLKNATEVDATIDSTLIAAAGSATITVTNSAGTSGSFTLAINAAAPVITSLTPLSGAVGDTVVIAGSNFGASQGTSTVMFGTTAATVSSGNWSNNSITTTVPVGVTGTVAVAVTVNGVQSNIDQTFTVKAALPTISGTVSSAGASVQLYAAGTSGYGYGASGPTKVVGSAATSDSTTGHFSGIPYDCSALPAPHDQLYLVATGTNNQVVLMTALGTCGSLSTSGTTVTINEVTTIASAYALSGFAALDTTNGGIDIGAPATYDATNAPKCDASPDNWQSTGANTCNYLGLQNAFKTVNNLVNIGNGQALTITPYYANLGATSGDVLNSSYVPQARINSLANFLASCVQGTSGCSTLFNAAGNSSLKDTLQAALYIAQHPGANVATLYALQTAEATPPYTPELTSTPNDWTIALTFTGGGLGLTPTIAAGGNPGQAPSVKGVVIDATGHIWLAVNNGCLDLNSYSSVGEVVEFDNQGNAVSPAAANTNSYCGGFQPQYNGSAAFGGGNIALDQEGNLWGAAAQNSSIAKVSSDGTTGKGVYNLSNVPVTSGSTEQCNPSSLAADASGHIWMGCSDGNGNGIGGIAAVNTSDGSTFGGENLDNPGKPTQTPIAELDSIALDPLGSVLGVIANPTPLGNSFSTADLYQISATSKSAVLNDYSTIGRTFVNSVVVDNSNNVFSISATLGTINALAPDGTTWTSLSYPMPASADGASIGMEQLALDGAGNLWGPVCAGDPGSAGAPSYLVRMTADGHLLSPSTATVYGYTGSGGGGENQVVLTNWAPYQPAMTGVAIDGSGNLWITNYSLPNSYLVPDGTPNGQQLVEFVGIAAPVTTPAVQALANNALGARP